MGAGAAGDGETRLASRRTLLPDGRIVAATVMIAGPLIAAPSALTTRPAPQISAVASRPAWWRPWWSGPPPWRPGRPSRGILSPPRPGPHDSRPEIARSLRILGDQAAMSVTARPAAGVALLALAFTILWWKASTSWFFQLFS